MFHSSSFFRCHFYSLSISSLSPSLLSPHLFSLSSNGKRIVVREREDGKCSVQFSSGVLDSGLDLTRDLFLYPFPFSYSFSSSYSFPPQHVDILQTESMYPIPSKFRKHETTHHQDSGFYRLLTSSSGEQIPLSIHLNILFSLS